MLARYSARLAAATPEQLGALEGEVRLFIEALWTEASAEARSRFLDAVRRVGPPMPWSALRVAPGGAPAALELILGQVDPDDEGVPGYRIDPKSEQGERALEALAAWDTQKLTALATPGGWNHATELPPDAPEGAAPAPEATMQDQVAATPATSISRAEIALVAAVGWGVAALSAGCALMRRPS
ncbi:MAG: hypothetical protein IPK80_35060 [Nannocystis sp.]|nr:hypothetical protein [Nannocystis sp.]